MLEATLILLAAPCRGVGTVLEATLILLALTCRRVGTVLEATLILLAAPCRGVGTVLEATLILLAAFVTAAAAGGSAPLKSKVRDFFLAGSACFKASESCATVGS